MNCPLVMKPSKWLEKLGIKKFWDLRQRPKIIRSVTKEDLERFFQEKGYFFPYIIEEIEKNQTKTDAEPSFLLELNFPCDGLWPWWHNCVSCPNLIDWTQLYRQSQNSISIIPEPQTNLFLE